MLRHSKERLECAAAAAEELGWTDLAEEMQTIASEMPKVRDAESAARLAERLEPVIDESWELGRSCNLSGDCGTDQNRG